MRSTLTNPQIPLPPGVTALARNVHGRMRRRYPRDLGPDVCAAHYDGDLHISGYPTRSYTTFYLYRRATDTEAVLTLHTRVGEALVHPADLGALYARHGNLAIEALEAATTLAFGDSSPCVDEYFLSAVGAALTG